MFLWFIEQWRAIEPAADGWFSGAEKITFRAALAAGASFLLAVLLGGKMIAWLAERFREPIQCDSPDVARLHQAKQSTPTMGGLFIVAGIVAGALLFGDLANPLLWIALLATLALAALGAVDDLAKLRTGRGVAGRAKLLAQTAIATVVAGLVYAYHARYDGNLQFSLPLVGESISLGGWFIPLAVVVIVGSSNAVNLTDGLDGLAGGCLMFAGAAMGLIVYVAGHAHLAEYMNVTFIRSAGELSLLAAAMLGAVLGFLWFNCHPAQVFMGDTGSLPLGGLLGVLAIIARAEWLLAIVGGVFVVEAASVIIQVVVYRRRRRRVFLCAPLHHHFQLKGWPESKIVVRFWIAAALCALLAVACLKLNVYETTTRPASERAEVDAR